MSIGIRIRKIRGDLSREAFASKMGVDKSTVQRYEVEDNIPKGDVLKRMHEIFAVNINWLLTGEGEPFLLKDETIDRRETLRSADLPVFKMPTPVESDLSRYSKDGRLKRVVKRMAPEEKQEKYESEMDEQGRDISVSKETRKRSPVSPNQALAAVREILESEDPLVISLLKESLNALQQIVRRNEEMSAQSSKIKELEVLLIELKGRVATLEKKEQT